MQAVSTSHLAPSVSPCKTATSKHLAVGTPPVKRFRGGLVFKAHRLVYHPNLGSRVIKKKKKREPVQDGRIEAPGGGVPLLFFCITLEPSDTQVYEP